MPFVYSFLDENFDRLYRNEARMGRLLGITTTLGLVIAMGTVSLQGLKAAHGNPANSLRNE